MPKGRIPKKEVQCLVPKILALSKTYSYAIIADILGISRSSVAGLIFRSKYGNKAIRIGRGKGGKNVSTGKITKNMNDWEEFVG